MENNKFILRSFLQSDYRFVEKILDYSNENSEYELGYPRCDNFEELISEVELYENTLEESIYIISHKDKPVAIDQLVIVNSF